MLVTAQSVFGATYYVDFSGGSDANNGTATGSPFQHCPGDSSATGTASSASLAAGDTVIFKGGVEYKHTITLSWSGSSGSPITYDGNSAGTFGTGKAVFNGENTDSDTRRYGFYASATRNYLTFKNMEFKLFGGHASNTFTCGDNTTAYTVRGWGIYFSAGSNLTVQDCYFHDLGDWQNAANLDGGYMEGVGIGHYATASSSSVTISNCEFTKCGRAGIQLSSATSLTGVSILNCNIHDYVRWGIDLAGSANNCTLNGITIDGLTLHDDYQYAADTWLGCSAQYPHYDGIIMRLANVPPVNPVTLGTSGSPIIIRNSFFYVNSATADSAGTAEVFLTTFGGRILIYNNVFTNWLSNGEGAIYAQDGIDNRTASTPVDYHIYNNSFYGANYMYFGRTVTTPLANFALSNGTVRVKNNIFYKVDSGGTYAVVTSLDQYSQVTELDYNIYVTGRSDNKLVAMRPGGTIIYYTLAELQTAGFETHGAKVDPKYVDTSFGLGANTSQNDLHLQATSPAIGAGADLSSYFTTDKAGTTRTAPWEIGAYEYADGRQPGAPGNLQIGK